MSRSSALNLALMFSLNSSTGWDSLDVNQLCLSSRFN